MAPSVDCSEAAPKDMLLKVQNWPKEDNGKSKKILCQMNDFRLQELFCDIELTCDDGRRFPAHKLVLASVSPYFKAMFENEMIEKNQSVITIKYVDSSSLGTLIEYAYTSELHLDFESIWALLQAANMLCFEDVEKDCVTYLLNNLSMENCIDICGVAESIHCSELRNLAGMFVTKNFRLLVKNSAFLRLSPHQLGCILNDDSLNVSSEAEVYDAVLNWTKYDQESRKQFLSLLLQHVRLIYLSRKYLVDRVMKESLVMDDSSCRQLVLQALDHHLLPERRLESTLLHTSPRKPCNRILFVLGGEANHQTLKSGECFDFKTETWTSLTPMIMPRKHVAVAALDGLLYAIGGVNNEYQDLITVEKYDIDNAVWSQVASLTKCKGALCVSAVDGWLYAAGGSCNSSALKFVERYDPFNDSWTEITSMRLPRSHFGMASMRGKLYAVGGYCGISEVEHCECFDPQAGKWSEITGMNKSRMNHSVVSYGDRMYAIGGTNSLGSLNSIEKFHPDLCMWLVIKNCISLRNGVGVAVTYPAEADTQELMIVGGKDSTSKEQNEVRKLYLKSPDYDVSVAPSMLEKRIFPGTCLL